MPGFSVPRFVRRGNNLNLISFAVLALSSVSAAALPQSASESPKVPIPFFYDAGQRTALKNLLQSDPTNVAIRSALVSAYERDNASSQATEDILWFIEHQPDHWVLTAYGRSEPSKLPVADSQLDQAKALWEQQIVSHADMSLVLLNAGLFLECVDFSKARDLFERARKLEPTNPVFVFAEGRAFAMQPDTQATYSTLLASRDFELLSAAGWALVATSANKTREALGLEFMAKAAELDPNNRQLRKALETAQKPTAITQRASAIEQLKPGTSPILKIAPIYPQEAKSAREQGTVVFSVVIDRYGFPTSARLIRGSSLLVQPAANALQRWIFKPLLVSGAGVSIETATTFNFEL